MSGDARTGDRRGRSARPRLWGAAAAAAAVLACYGTIAAIVAFSAIGLSVSVDEGLWASAIAVAAVAAVVAVGLNMRCHWRPLPLLLAVAGAGLILYALFFAYHPLTEGLGFLVLLAAVAADYRLTRAIAAETEKPDTG